MLMHADLFLLPLGWWKRLRALRAKVIERGRYGGTKSRTIPTLGVGGSFLPSTFVLRHVMKMELRVFRL